MIEKSIIKDKFNCLSLWLQGESTILNTLALTIGVLTGMAIVVYDLALKSSTELFFGSLSETPGYYVIFIPMIGGLIVGFLIHLLISPKRCDVEDVIKATALYGGRLKNRNAFLEVLASIISIGSGGSVGKEAPGILAGSGIGSSIARLLNVPDNRSRILLACGASGGIAAAFNAPLAGVVFVVEVIFGQLETRTFIPIVISSVFATLVSNQIFGVRPIQASYYGLVDPLRESILYLLLGLIAGVFSVILIRSMYLSYDLFERIDLHTALKPALGGLCVGIIGYFYPQVFGIGYDVIESAISNELTLNLLLVLIVLKIIAFSVTMGSGGSGGSIVPSLFVGAMLGGAFGTIAHSIFPAFTAEPGAYVLVGMAAVFAGTLHAPLTAILILFELTMDYNLILPLMFACVVSNATSSSLHGDSLFTEGLKRRGFALKKGHEVDVMSSLLVRDAMVCEVQTVFEDWDVGTLITRMRSSQHAGFPVLDSKGRLKGIVTIQDLRDKVKKDALDLRIGDIATTNVIVAYPDESLDVVLERLARKDIGRLPVVSRSDEIRLIGLITRSDIVNSYNKTIVTRFQSGQDTY